MKAKIYSSAIEELSSLKTRYTDLSDRSKLRDTAFAIIKRSGDESMSTDFEENSMVNYSYNGQSDLASILDAIDVAIEEFKTMLRNQEIIDAEPPKVVTTTTKTTTTTNSGGKAGYISLGYFFTFLIAGISGGYAVGNSIGGNRYDKEKFEIATQNEKLMGEIELIKTECENRFTEIRSLKELAEEKLHNAQKEIDELKVIN